MGKNIDSSTADKSISMKRTWICLNTIQSCRILINVSQYWLLDGIDMTTLFFFLKSAKETIFFCCFLEPLDNEWIFRRLVFESRKLIHSHHFTKQTLIVHKTFATHVSKSFNIFGSNWRKLVKGVETICGRCTNLNNDFWIEMSRTS